MNRRAMMMSGRRTVWMPKQRLFRKLKYYPHPAQIEIHRSRANRRIVACGVRFGKTWCAAMEAIAAAMEPRERSMTWVVGPTYDLAEKVYREIVTLCTEHLRHRIILLKDHEKRLILLNLSGGISEIRGKSADNPIGLLGEALDFLVVDEAARLHPRVWEGHLVQRLLDRKGRAILISTPHGFGWFHNLYLRGQSDDPDYASWNFPSWANPYLDAETIERERERLPERVWKQEYAGCFTEGSGAVFSRVHECATGEWQEPIEKARYFAGLDVARIADYTVLVVLDASRRVVFVDRFNRVEWSTQVARVRAACERYNNAVILMDSTGVGDPVANMFRREGCEVIGYKFTAASKSRLIDNLVVLLEGRQIVLPRPELWPEGIRELESYQYSVSDAGNTRSSAPAGQHDDCVIALALAAWLLRPRPKSSVGIAAPRRFFPNRP
jgi:hypothetical protein